MANDTDIAELDPLNNAAFGALMGWSKDWQADLVNLLRSDTPISIANRNMLADAIEGTHSFGLTVVLKGHGKRANRMEGLKARHSWFEDGIKAAPFVERFGTTDGFAKAAEELGKDETHWRKCYYYAKNCQNWMIEARASSKFYRILNDHMLREHWHLASIDQDKEIKPVPLSGEEFDSQTRARISLLREIFDGRPYAKIAVNAMLILAWLSPPDP